MNKPLQIVIIVVCTLGAGYMLFGYFTRPSPTANEGPPPQSHFVCANPACKAGFTYRRGENTGDRAPTTCPECGTPEALRAAKCPSCSHYQILAGHGTYESPCPECGKDMPPLREQE